MIKIGVVNLDVSHPLAFAQYLFAGERARFTAVYNDGFREDDEVDGFIKKFNLEKRYYSLAEMAEHIDIAFIQGCDWDRHAAQALPFIEKGVPVFIDKPVCGSLADCETLEKLANGGAVILGSSSLRYADEISAFFAIPEDERGQTVSIFASAGVDEFNYAIHAVEAMCGVSGGGAQSVRYAGSGSAGSSVCETYHVSFSSGISGVYNTFCGVWQPHMLVITTTKTTFSYTIDSSKVYAALLDRICDKLEGRCDRLAPLGDLTGAVRIMLAGKASKTAGGAPFSPYDLPAGISFDGAAFASGYAAKSSKIYL